ncbi:MAG: radical SAM family heme chaperone HemW [Bacteroidales bacterium]|nr:radical SAM family heme chaperone HemW [Bacteroidales bacterium]
MVYIHVPFCRSFCVYCDFYSEIACGRASKTYVRGVCAEIDARREEIADCSGTDTLYIGGGTPSVLPLSDIARIVETLGKKDYDEFTIEVNPDDITPDYAQGLRTLGVNRISMGVQSLSDPVLRWMRRRHDAAGAARAFQTLRKAGFDNISVDMIFGFDTYDAATLDTLLSWRPEHLSAYQLSIETGSALAEQLAAGQFREASDETCRTQYDQICGQMRDAGYEHYEISNWSLPGRHARHNEAYWRRVPYVGLGPGAHSLRKTGGQEIRSWNSQELSGWHATQEILTKEEIREEQIMLGLRTAEGIELDGRHIRIPERDFFIADSIILKML